MSFCVCVVSLDQEIIRFKPQKRRIKGGRGGRSKKKGGGVLCREGEGGMEEHRKGVLMKENKCPVHRKTERKSGAVRKWG